MIEIQLKVFKTKHDIVIFNVNAHQMTNSSSNFVHRSAFMGPSLVRCSSVVRGFDRQNISSQKPRTREVLSCSSVRYVPGVVLNGTLYLVNNKFS